MSASEPASDPDASSPPATVKEVLVATTTAESEVEGSCPRADCEKGVEPTPAENGPAQSSAEEEMPEGGVKEPEVDTMESSSVATADNSDDMRESGDPVSFSVPDPDLSEETMMTTAESPKEADGVSSSPQSASGAEERAPAEEAPGSKDDAVAGSSIITGDAGMGAMAPEYYLVKWITWKGKKTPIITQSDNGPCPLLAIMNILFLRWKAKLPAQTEVVTTEELMTHLGECVLSVTPREKTTGMQLNFQQNMSDAMAVLPKLSTGLDVNVRFTGVTDFEYTPECIVFDLLDIPLYHGWLVDPQSPEMVAAVGKLSYNQLVEKIIEYKHSTDSVQVSEGLAAEHFLETTATQLSYHGLCELNAAAKEGETCVFFRNNHFNTMIKHKGHLYLLVTDQGFLCEDGLVWESLHNVEGDGNFCDSNFRLCHPPQRLAAASGGLSPPGDQKQRRQIDQRENGREPAGNLSDLELARQLQQEEYQQQQQGPQQATAQVRGQGSQQSTARRREKDSDCVIL
ncbi:ubiquitin carboxyl-terminal hydrolase MINDY-1 isoform X2 [Corythoichthys intestinalis]|uniref:ubiquitin carboxyl-terminal hydrolase MINDY-1 isoform X2 n=1 Tax=Corythoichthys intestinalis TaxID=161448 RepID=UPI0025A5030F|nr:ubiquitin carboxyl-terminal hydrolase MINDY-1 isoform X2 [Corythoichthys intestinalis]